MRFIPMSVLLLGFVFAATPAAAWVGIEEVRAMAFDKGIVKLKEIELDDGVWEVEGRDAGGREIEMEVDAASGAIIRLERD